MAGVFKRASDRARGKSGKWSIWWLGADGKRHRAVGVTDRARSLEIAQHRETEARRVREGLADPRDATRREASFLPIGKHIESYRLDLLAKGVTTRHASHIASVLTRLFADASVQTLPEITVDRIQGALGRLKQVRSARTCNHARDACKAFLRWAVNAGRLKEIPMGIASIKPFNEQADRRHERRALTEAELLRLLAATATGSVVSGLTPAERVSLYVLAMGTGFRANELRSLTPESFHLEGDRPTVTVLAAYAKNRRTVVQPIRQSLAFALQAIVEGKPPGEPVLKVPKYTAQLLRHDLDAAGIPYRDERGRVVDFHALRSSYITHLVAAGVHPRVVQRLARHSKITLTMDRYAIVEDEDLRNALEKGREK